MRQLFFSLILAFSLAGCGARNVEAPSQGFSQKTANLDHKPGLFDIYVDKNGGRILGALPAPDEEGVFLSVIYASGLTAGLGSNPIGLDRGGFDPGMILTFRRVGAKVIAEAENWTYRASADRALEKRAVRESFARSFLWSGDILAKAGDGRILVDLSSFLTRDHFGSAAAIKRHPEGGTYKLAPERSLPDTARALAFPDNLEFDAFLTFTSETPGREARATAADARAVTLVQHHSFIRLPDAGYVPRIADQRTGAIEVAYYDFSSSLDAPIVQRLARRFRLERDDPSATTGPVKKPIVFYVDPGAPKQIQDALIEGASWWAEAFEAAGFEDAYRVELLPDGAHPFDVRYNMIQWTHRQTRGWSYGGGVFDPRTGEMLKANVILGSQRVRQDRMIFEGLAGAQMSGSGTPDDPVVIALARIRQLAAHEVGHTLGFAHNFAASSNDRASVMDYPAPFIRARTDGTLDFSKAYGVGVGAWDIFATRWLYSEFPDGADEEKALNALVDKAYASGLRYIADGDARALGTAHPHGAVWDNGADAIAALDEVMEVRRIALSNFGPNVLGRSRPLSDLNEVLVPIYLYHRYQLAAAAKSIGGLSFSYPIKGDTLPAASPVPAADQRRALRSVLATLDPKVLDLPDHILNALTPKLGGDIGGETFSGRTGPVFDLLSAADTASDLTLSALLHPARSARLIEFQRRDPSALGFGDVLDALEGRIFAPVETDRYAEISYIIQARFVTKLIALSTSDGASVAVRSTVDDRLFQIRDRLAAQNRSTNRRLASHAAWLANRITAHLEREEVAHSLNAPEVILPPGSPIGSPGQALETCWHC